MIATANPTTKLCQGCWQELPLDRFRLRRRGTSRRQGVCRVCYNAYMRAYRAKRRSKKIARFGAELRREADVHRVVVLCAGMITRFGGVEGFCDAWYRQIRAVRPGSREALNACAGILRLLAVVDSAGQDAVGQLSGNDP